MFSIELCLMGEREKSTRYWLLPRHVPSWKMFLSQTSFSMYCRWMYTNHFCLWWRNELQRWIRRILRDKTHGYYIWSKEIRDRSLAKQGKICVWFLCPFGECIPLRHVNDLMADCPNPRPYDEDLFPRLRFNNERFVYKDPRQIPCVAGLSICFLLANFCLYDYDQYGIMQWCRNGANLGNCAAINCTNSYKCPGSYCIPFHRFCDGRPDCIQGEDEVQCDDYICRSFLRCSD